MIFFDYDKNIPVLFVITVNERGAFMKAFVLKIVITGLSLLVVDWMLPGVTLSHSIAAIAAAFVLGLINAIIRPVLVVLTFPITILTGALITSAVHWGLNRMIQT